MSKIAALSPRKWLSTISEIFISIVSAIVFFILDILDVVMCVVFRVLDEFLEGKPSSCYCIEENKDDCNGVDGDSGLSESLHGRKNLFRKMGFLRNPSGEKGSSFVANNNNNNNNSWSDCKCESCVSWMIRNGTDFRLHVVKQQKRARPETGLEGSTVQNVIFIHGFLSSSSLWKETVFPNLSEHSNQNYNLFAVDLLGFGRSPKPSDCFYTLRDHVEMIEKSVIHPFQIKSFHLVAHSMGCVIALALAAKYSESVKSITLIAPPYISSSKGDVSVEALKRLATRRVWPPLLFGSAFMSWYEHLGRCVCFIICRNHRTWEWLLKLLTRKRNLHFTIVDLTCHTHRSAWHTMHNVICGGAKFSDKYLGALTTAGVKIRVVQGTKDQVVPLECSFNMKKTAPEIELEIVPNADHSTVILGRMKEFTRSLEILWASTDEKINGD
ncbi:hypothetical protein CASFOL_026994 [Castilleja foliolosa]|uniref:AB hydrolase-1 domain-containing protein n=1 Tax=Castilleja foliolosa TaxID=1961234 RepID=A0ABD3CJK7_9LAMI